MASIITQKSKVLFLSEFARVQKFPNTVTLQSVHTLTTIQGWCMADFGSMVNTAICDIECTNVMSRSYSKIRFCLLLRKGLDFSVQ